jgi:hypothetical protein
MFHLLYMLATPDTPTDKYSGSYGWSVATKEMMMYYGGFGPDPSADCTAEKETGSLKKVEKYFGGRKSDEQVIRNSCSGESGLYIRGGVRCIQTLKLVLCVCRVLGVLHVVSSLCRFNLLGLVSRQYGGFPSYENRKEMHLCLRSSIALPTATEDKEVYRVSKPRIWFVMS